ncbi:hypothetical protein [Granulicella sp. dw_53]|uniref:hypothetical protein n=1 Tax=Granulicella sp. dw_53 TaxID=2719792 RepID=UPI001BD4F3B6|nr:hypothetical protein [Granulicella sp. dw_53]
MQTPTFTRCSHSDKSCTGTCVCTGYKTSNSCPPLIVLAVLALATPIAVLPCVIGASR